MKGRDWEQIVRRDLGLIFGNDDVKRRPQSAFYNKDEADVEAPGWSGECKSGHSFSLRKAWDQANVRKAGGTNPFLALRMIKKGGGSHSEKLVVMGYALFLELLRELQVRRAQ
jgi:hypothetical protein